MAEQEACAELVEKASDEAATKESGSTVHGESLLLPLLQGLLDQPAADNDQPADSGTESGEDLRTGLILEVQNALGKLSATLRNPRANIAEERRESLLQLVTRLQSGLSASQLSGGDSSVTSSGERRSSLHQGRFSKRKQRPNRHTVGVTSEELEDARRLMEEIALHQSATAAATTLQKQNSEGSVSQTAPFKPLSQRKPVTNVTAKPFISTNVLANSHSSTSASSAAETPPDTSKLVDFPLSNTGGEDKSIVEGIIVSDDGKDGAAPPRFTHSQSLQLFEKTKRAPLAQTGSLDYNDRDTLDLIAVQRAVTQAAAIKQLSQLKDSNNDVSDARADSDTEEEDEDDEEEESHEDDDDDDDEKISKNKEFEQQKLQQQQQPQPDLIMQTNPLYNKSYNPPTTYDDNNNNNNNDKDNQDNNTKNENDDYPTHLNERANRFNNKKLKMKRANTIDIPKPLKYYECDDEDSDNDETASNNRRNSYLALRGPIRVGKTSEQQKRVPDFQPKTESDKKFAAFLRNNYNTNEESTHNKPSSIWCNNSQAKTVASNWSSKFGNIKNTFDKIQPGNAVNSARNFWKSADDAVTAGRTSYMGPKISRQSAKNLQQMFEEKQKEKQGNIVTGQLKVAQPNAINKFSHAPLSAFKPVQKKIEVPQVIQSQNREQREPPLYLYSPKQLSPVNGPPVVPWNTGRAGGESRVLSIAASKFQNLPPPEKPDVPTFTPRRLSKEKIVMPRSIPAQEKPHVPYVVKSNVINNNSVRKLSGQYDNLGNKAAERRIFVPGENYTIKYENPVVKSPPPQPRIYNADYTVTQHCYVPNDPHRQESLGESEIHNQKQREMYSKIREVPQDPQQFTSNYQYRPSSKPSPADKSSGYEAKSFVYERQTSQESVKEYTAVSSKVMSAPITQQAVTVQQNAPKSREQHDMELNLKATLQQKFSSQSVVDYPEHKMATSDATLSKKSPPSVMTASDEIALTVSPKKSPPLVMTTPSETVLTMSPKKLVTTSPDREDKVPPPLIVYNNVKPRPSLRVNDQPLSLESLEINERGETVLTGKFQIPTRGQPAEIRSPPMALSKSESWHQICKAVAGQTTTKPVARASPNSRSIARSKSSHTLAVPKQFEAGMSKTEMLEKRKTMEAYFGVSASTKPESKKTTSSSINRVKTSQKISTQRQNSTSGMSTGLCRSKTLPDIVCSDKLDDSSIDALFEDLFINSST